MPFQPNAMTEELDALGQIGNPSLFFLKFETCGLVQIIGKSGLFVLGLLASACHQDHKIIGLTDREEYGDPRRRSVISASRAAVTPSEVRCARVLWR